VCRRAALLLNTERKRDVKRVQVECYAGYKGDERPVRVKTGEQSLEVEEVEDRWYSPGETYFRVRVAGGDRYVLRHVEAQDVWSLEGYRKAEVE
jgi:hypothetical protein